MKRANPLQCITAGTLTRTGSRGQSSNQDAQSAHIAIRIMKKMKYTRRFVDWIFDRTWQRSGMIQKYEHIGLAVFVGIPLPFTGAWTGAIAATILGFSFKRAFFSILMGVIIAGVIVTCLSLLGWTGAIIAGLALCIGAIIGMWRW